MPNKTNDASQRCHTIPNQYQHQYDMSTSEYLQSIHVRTYLNDALLTLPSSSSSSFSSSSSSSCSSIVLQHFREYFHLLCSGQQIIHRPFKFINSTPYNRLSFINCFRLQFHQYYTENINNINFHISSENLHELCQLLCFDFPFSLVKNAARIIRSSSSSSTSQTTTLTFNEITHNLFVLFYFSEFLNHCALLFRSCDIQQNGKILLTKYHQLIINLYHEKYKTIICPDEKEINNSFRKLIKQYHEQQQNQQNQSNSNNKSINPLNNINNEIKELDQNQNNINNETSNNEIMLAFNEFCVELFNEKTIANKIYNQQIFQTTE